MVYELHWLTHGAEFALRSDIASYTHRQVGSIEVFREVMKDVRLLARFEVKIS